MELMLTGLVSVALAVAAFAVGENSSGSSRKH